MTFGGFGSHALPFLKALAFHQTKEWFEANRATYENDLKTPMGDFVESLSDALADAKIQLKGDRKSSLFRINRDVRFAKDKSPYKTNVGAVLTRGGTKDAQGLLYLHVAVEGCFAAAGFYNPVPEDLTRLRAGMARSPKAWKAIVAKLEKRGLSPSQEYALKRLPRGYEDVDDEAVAAGLRLKSIVVSRPVAETRLREAGLVEDVLSLARDALPLLEWGWDALSDVRTSVRPPAATS